MREAKRMRLTRRQQLEDVPELVQHIQSSLLPPKHAARTCILSKSWLHAWSTTPILRLCRSAGPFSKQQERRYMRLIRRTIRRYHRDNIPIIACDLHFSIHKQKSATRVEKWIKRVASKTCLKELRLTIFDDIASFTLPDEIFSSENLNTLSIKLGYSLHIKFPSKKNRSLHISGNPLIDCVNLQVLELLEVNISEEVFHNLLSTCKLLEKINIKFTEGLKKIKVNNLCYLEQLKMAPGIHGDIFEMDDVEISDVPRLRSFYYDASMLLWDGPVLFKMDSIRSLRELYLMNVFFNDAFSDVIKRFPFLEGLTLKIKRCKAEIMDISCATLQRLEIQSWQPIPFKVQVNAPKLLFLGYTSVVPPSLFFPTMAPEQIKLSLMLNKPIDDLFFLKMRETLKLPSKFNIEIKSDVVALVPFNIDDLRTRIPFPATNVEKLSFETCFTNGLWDKSVLFDAFFSICQPMYVEADLQVRLKVAKYFLKLMKEGPRKDETGKVYWPHLKCGEIRNGGEGKWEKLTSASLSMLDGTLPVVGYFSEFKLSWGFL